MAKSEKKRQARELRRKGNSIKDIADKLQVSKGSVSLWCKDISLSKDQIEKLEIKMNKASYKGRLKGAATQKQKRLDRMVFWEKRGQEEIKKISKQEKLLIGLALYWGEGGKNENKVAFSNSDPAIISFILKWFKEIFNIKKNQFAFQIGINILHKNRYPQVLTYWQNQTGMLKSQFQKPSFKKTKVKKKYEDMENHFGTLRITVKKSSELFYRIRGLIKAIDKAA
ncbi:hypothetical protein KKC88_00035 [Patescibacteria group bacterium]|nr:hypothetical protein [Patescibacteria group bacterium]MBU1673022.1 hypothetical protein [Patescibacteria group bacterium]MBU1963291.1 hypothetical protein [Patescibacteria group bacterium]